MCENCIDKVFLRLVFSPNVGDSEDMKRVDKLFVDGQFDPLDSHSLDELLDIPLQRAP